MTRGASTRGASTRGAPPRVGLFGILGDGNIGNDASLEVVLGHLRREHPDAIVDVMTSGGAAEVTAAAGVPAVSYGWRRPFSGRPAMPVRVALGLVGLLVEALRTAAWVRRHDLVIVPGMGVLEASIPLRPWEFPIALFTACLSGRLFGVRVALVCVGADPATRPSTRWLLNAAARAASYRSYRDEGSRRAMAARGLDVGTDPVYADLVFEGHPLRCDDKDAGPVVVGVMAYYGSDDDDRADGPGIHAAYVQKMTRFVGRLVDDGHTVRLVVGDRCDLPVADVLRTNVLAARPDIDGSVLSVAPVTTFAELAQAIGPARCVVATRFHNIVCALMLGKPTISVGYAAKSSELMADMGLSNFCNDARSLDVDDLVVQFRDVTVNALEVRQRILTGSARNGGLIEDQLVVLSGMLRSATRSGAEHGGSQECARR